MHLAMPRNSEFVKAGDQAQKAFENGSKSVFISGGIVSDSGAIAFKFVFEPMQLRRTS